MDLAGLSHLLDTVTDVVAKGSALATTVAAAFFAFYSWLRSRSSDHSAKRARAAAEIAERTLHTTVNQYAAQLVIEAGKMFIEHPDMRPYFFHGEPWPEPPADQLQQALAVAQSHLDVMETIWDHHDDIDSDDVDAWREWMHDVFEAPLVQRGYEPAWYPSLSQMLEEHGCSNHQAHKFAAAYGDRHAQAVMSVVLQKIASFQVDEPLVDAEVVPLIADAAEAEFKFNHLRHVDAARGLGKRLRQAEMEKDDDLVSSLKDDLADASLKASTSLRRAIVLGAAFERHSQSRMPAAGSIAGMTERLRRLLARIFRVEIPSDNEPARPPELHELVWSDAHRDAATDGRSRTIRGAAEFATELHPSP